MANLPTTNITLNVGSPAADIVFVPQQAPTPGVTMYAANSPTGDLAGRQIMTNRHNTSASGLVTTIVQVRKPVLNSSTGLYDSWIQGDIKLTRPASAPIQGAKDMLEILEEYLEVTDVRNALAEANY